MMKKWCGKVIAMLTIVVMITSNLSVVLAVKEDSIGKALGQLFSKTDFSDGDLWGFSPGGGTAATVNEDAGNKFLNITGAGNGGRSVTKTLSDPTTDSKVLFTFDWKPGDVTTDRNSSEILISDTSDNPLFRLIKAGGTNGELLYDIGNTGTDLSHAKPITGVSTNGLWLSVRVLFDFIDNTVSFDIHDRDDRTNSFQSTVIDLNAIQFVNHISKISVNGNRESGNTLNFETGLDDMEISFSGDAAPEQRVQNIVSIESDYETEKIFPEKVEKEDVISFLPDTLQVKLENDLLIDVNVSWDSDDYNPEKYGIYTFEGVLNIEGIANIANSNEIKASIKVVTKGSAEVPEIEGYETVYFSDFGDTVEVVPPNWGFNTANATLSINDDNLAGNSTPKLSFNMTDQSGGRVATKDFNQPVKGNKILVKFDWYPGKVNDKGDKAAENGGEFRILDSSNNTIFTLNHTNQAPLSYFVGNQAPTVTSITNPEAWYGVEVQFELSKNEVYLTLTNKETEISESYTSSLDGMAFDGSISSMKLVGLRTSGNNITWTTSLDNFGVYHVAVSDNTITKVNKLPYHRVYVNETAEDPSLIGLPETVNVTLADNRQVDVKVEKWVESGSKWNPSVSGVYEFKGILAQTEGMINEFNKEATIYVYNRYSPPQTARQTEWLDRGGIALKSQDGMFISWRLLADEYKKDISFNLYRNGEQINQQPLSVTNYTDREGKPTDIYKVETQVNGKTTEQSAVKASKTDYLSISMQKPAGGTTATGDYTYSVNDSSVGDLDGDGEYEVIVKWYPSNAIDSSQEGMTGPTIFDAYKMDGTLLWRINMGLNLTSGAHYNQFIVADFDGNGKSEFLIKTADGTTSYGVTDGKADASKVISIIGNAEDNGKYVDERGHITGGPEYMSVFNGETGEVIDTIDYAFPLGDVSSWGDTWHNRSDRFLAGLAYLDGKSPSAIYGRGYYERTTFVAYRLNAGKLEEEWTFDSSEEGRGAGLGYHSLATGDVDNDGFDEIIAGSLTLDEDGSILYAMDGEKGRELGSHGDALHVGAFDPSREGLHVFGVHEVPAVASVELHDGATGETLMSYHAGTDTGRGLAANITSSPGYEFWGTGGADAKTGGGIYNVQGNVVADSFRAANLSVNFALYWDGDLLHELLDNTSITKYNENTGVSELVKQFEDVVSNNGTKATPTLQADILGDWREEVLLPTTDSSELRIFSTTIPTEYRMFTFMHDPVYRNAVAWQNTAYNQPPHISFYLGEDIGETVLAGHLQPPNVIYTKQDVEEEPNVEKPDTGENELPNEKPELEHGEKAQNDVDEKDKDIDEQLHQDDKPNKETPKVEATPVNSEDGKRLPATATNMYNLVIIGAICLLVGLFVLRQGVLRKTEK